MYSSLEQDIADSATMTKYMRERADQAAHALLRAPRNLTMYKDYCDMVQNVQELEENLRILIARQQSMPTANQFPIIVPGTSSIEPDSKMVAEFESALKLNSPAASQELQNCNCYGCKKPLLEKPLNE